MNCTYYFVLTDLIKRETIYAYHKCSVVESLGNIIVHLELNNYTIEIVTKDVPPSTFTTVPVHEVAELIA